MLRSNTSEIIRAYHLSNGFPDEPVTPAYRMKIASKMKCKDLHARDAFSDMSIASQFDWVAQHGYDALDFHHWEYRVGVWLTNVIQETDVACDTAVPLNSRRVYDLLLSVSRQDRGSGLAQLAIVHEWWPEVLQVPVNGRDESGVDLANLEWRREKVRKRSAPG